MEWSTNSNVENVRVAFMPPPWPESSSFNSLHSFNFDPYAGIFTHHRTKSTYVDAFFFFTVTCVKCRFNSIFDESMNFKNLVIPLAKNLK